MRLLKLARLRFGCASESPFFIAKQGGFQQIVWNGSTVDGHIGFTLATGQGVDLSGKNIFADT